MPQMGVSPSLFFKSMLSFCFLSSDQVKRAYGPLLFDTNLPMKVRLAIRQALYLADREMQGQSMLTKSP